MSYSINPNLKTRVSYGFGEGPDVSYNQGLSIVDGISNHLQMHNATFVQGPVGLSCRTIETVPGAGEWVHSVDNTTLVSKFYPTPDKKSMQIHLATAGENAVEVLDDLKNIVNIVLKPKRR